MYIAQVTLAKPILSTPGNPTLQVVPLGSTLSAADNNQDGEYRQYAAGRIRMITTPTEQLAEQVTLIGLTFAQYNLVQRWMGEIVLYRDTQRRRIYGGYLAVRDERRTRSSVGEHVDVTVTFQRLSYSDKV